MRAAATATAEKRATTIAGRNHDGTSAVTVMSTGAAVTTAVAAAAPTAAPVFEEASCDDFRNASAAETLRRRSKSRSAASAMALLRPGAHAALVSVLKPPSRVLPARDVCEPGA